MPPIDLLEADGSLGPLAASEVLAVTLYPDDKEKRFELLVSVASQILVKAGNEAKAEKVEIPVAWLEVLIRAPSREKILTAAADYAANSWIAGELMLFMVTAAIHHPELDITLTKAILTLKQACEGVPTFGGGVTSFGKRTAWTAWGRFKSVAHFHAVRQLWLIDGAIGPGVEDWAKFTTGKRLAEYIALAETIRRAAVERKIVRHQDTWYAPPGMELPASGFHLPPFPESTLEIFARYSPEHSSDSGFE